MAKSQNPRKSTMESVSEAIWNPEKGTFMGRDKKSWARILGFYALYYTFLVFLFYGSVQLYKAQVLKIAPLDGAGSMLKSRLDQPGLSVWPHNDWRDDQDNLEFDLDEDLEEYVKISNEFLDQYKDATFVTSNLPAAMPYVAELSNVDFRKAAEAGEPIVFLALNRLAGWQPINVNSRPANIKPNSFIKDAVYFDCKNVRDNVVVNDFSIEPVAGTEAHTEKQFYSFNPAVTSGSVSKKPFVAFQVKANQGANFKNGENQRFKCVAYADNIQGPAIDDFNEQNPQAKNQIGTVTFGFKFDGKNLR